jgi:glutamine synthetase
MIRSADRARRSSGAGREPCRRTGRQPVPVSGIGQILAGLDGVACGLTAHDPVERPYESDAEKLPASLGEALAVFEASGFWAASDGAKMSCVGLPRSSARNGTRYLAHVSDWEEREYFGLF